jgi:hypothetical protein
LKRKKNKRNIDWHSGFAGGLGLCFRRYREKITIEREHLLSKQPLRIDFLVLKKQEGVLLDNAIGRGFRRYNIIEYKNPCDALNIDVIWKIIGYAGIYKSHGGKVDAISDDEITISLFRYKVSDKLLEGLKNRGLVIRTVEKGIYEITGLCKLPIRLISINELEEKELLALKVMVKNADEQTVRAFITESRNYSLPGDIQDADAVIQVSYDANRELFSRMRGDDNMCEAFRELFADELENEREQGIEQGIDKGIDQINKLYIWLFSNNRAADVQRAATDENFRKQMFEEYNASLK